MTKTPIAYIIFNRPSITKQSFAVLKEQKPLELFIIADGPRSEHPNDKKNCAEVRKIVEQIDWPCKVHRDYAKTNLGLKKRVSSGLNWVFDNVEKAIVLEDDCVPHLDFFTFCENLLDRYADDERVSVISGNNYQKGKWRGDASYYFSKYTHIWGWATWRRTWKDFQLDIPFWSKWKNSEAYLNFIPDKVERRYWEYIFERVQDGRVNSWAYPLMAKVWYKGGFTAIPNINLVENIGFGEDATNTKRLNEHESSKVSSLPFKKIIHPKIIQINKEADIYDFEWTFGGRDLRFPRSWILLPKRIFNFILKKFK